MALELRLVDQSAYLRSWEKVTLSVLAIVEQRTQGTPQPTGSPTPPLSSFDLRSRRPHLVNFDQVTSIALQIAY